ncbi:hypothetical protein G9A89_008436 [Geosiphon pyriformis]|nr:hypothetical protein G9A89_008436 [Geosiphon pyriformis]
MENKEIKRTRPETHDSNESKVYQSSSVNYNNCAACRFIFFEKLYRDFSIYGRVSYYEWVPWERFSNINKIARGELGIIYKALWIDELIKENSIKHYGSMEYER